MHVTQVRFVLVPDLGPPFFLILCRPFGDASSVCPLVLDCVLWTDEHSESTGYFQLCKGRYRLAEEH